MAGPECRHALGGCLSAAPGGGRRLEGYAAVFGVETRIGDFVEVIRRGAFMASMASGKDVLCLCDHDNSKLLGRTRSGTLRIKEDDKGLWFEVDAPATSLGDDIISLAQRGDLGGMSFGFSVSEGGEVWNGNRRELRAVKLHEISIVHAHPAYGNTSIHVRCKQPLLNRALRFLVTT